MEHPAGSTGTELCAFLDPPHAYLADQDLRFRTGHDDPWELAPLGPISTSILEQLPDQLPDPGPKQQGPEGERCF